MEFCLGRCYCEESNKYYIREIIKKLVKRENGRFRASDTGVDDILTLDGASLRSIMINYGQVIQMGLNFFHSNFEKYFLFFFKIPNKAEMANRHIPSRQKKIKSQLKSWGDGEERKPLGPYMGFENKNVKGMFNSLYFSSGMPFSPLGYTCVF